MQFGCNLDAIWMQFGSTFNQTFVLTLQQFSSLLNEITTIQTIIVFVFLTVVVVHNHSNYQLFSRNNFSCWFGCFIITLSSMLSQFDCSGQILTHYISSVIEGLIVHSNIKDRLVDHNDGSLPFHRWTNGQLPLETIEKPSGPMVAELQNHRKTIGIKTKTIVKPLLPMVCKAKNHHQAIDINDCFPTIPSMAMA